MLDSAPSSIMVAGIDGTIHYANRRTFELHGYTREEFSTLRLQDLDTPDSAAQFEARMREFNERGELAFEVEHHRKDRSVLPLEAVAHRVMWEGRPAILSIANDVTEKRALQTESMRHTRDLALFHLFVVGLATTNASELHGHIAQGLKDFAGAYFVTISDYDPHTRCLAHRHLAIEPGMAGRFVGFLGSRVEDIPTPLSDSDYQLVTHKGWTVEESLYEAAFGSLPRPVAAGLQKWLQLDRFIGFAFLDDDRLYGTTLLAMRRDQPDPSMEMLQAFRHVATIALRARAVAQDRGRLADELERLRPMELRGRLATSVAPDLERHLARIRERTGAALADLPPENDPRRVALDELLASVGELEALIVQLKTF
jgi:PAS domain S-box-containing protein